MDECICNITGKNFTVEDNEKHRELAVRFGANSRHRAVIYFLTKNIFKEPKILVDLEKNKNIKGIGMSDSGFDKILEDKFDYTNTFYHKEPFLDVYNIKHVNSYKDLDFIISSDVFEHINPYPNIQLAFDNLYKMLKPGGFVIFSVPYNDSEHVEHYPLLFNYQIEKIESRYIIKNETVDGKIEFYENPVFHGGPGNTLEMRQFSKDSIIEHFENANFKRIIFNGINKNHNKYGIYWECELNTIITAVK